VALTLSLLFDEDTEAEFARLCTNDGHDVERVVSVAELGSGVDDSRVAAYARSAGRIIVTHDDDFIRGTQSTEVFYAPNQRLSAFELYRIVSEVCELYPGQSALPDVVYLTEDWFSPG